MSKKVKLKRLIELEVKRQLKKRKLNEGISGSDVMVFLYDPNAEEFVTFAMTANVKDEVIERWPDGDYDGYSLTDEYDAEFLTASDLKNPSKMKKIFNKYWNKGVLFGYNDEPEDDDKILLNNFSKALINISNELEVSNSTDPDDVFANSLHYQDYFDLVGE